MSAALASLLDLAGLTRKLGLGEMGYSLKTLVRQPTTPNREWDRQHHDLLENIEDHFRMLAWKLLSATWLVLAAVFTATYGAVAGSMPSNLGTTAVGLILALFSAVTIANAAVSALVGGGNWSSARSATVDGVWLASVIAIWLLLSLGVGVAGQSEAG